MAIQIETFDSFVCSELQQKISRPSVLPGRFTPGIISLSEFTAPGKKILKTIRFVLTAIVMHRASYTSIELDWPEQCASHFR